MQNQVAQMQDQMNVLNAEKQALNETLNQVLSGNVTLRAQIILGDNRLGGKILEAQNLTQQLTKMKADFDKLKEDHLKLAQSHDELKAENESFKKLGNELQEHLQEATSEADAA